MILSVFSLTPNFSSYLIPCELRWELPVEQIILEQAETFVDQSVLRGRGGRRGRRKIKERQQDIYHRKTGEKQRQKC